VEWQARTEDGRTNTDRNQSPRRPILAVRGTPLLRDESRYSGATPRPFTWTEESEDHIARHG